MSEPSGPEDDGGVAEAARLLFARPFSFVLGARQVSQLPAPAGVEVAFAGRSNVGKSSLINAVTGRRALARTSNAPGRTREVNFFSADHAPLMLVDLPGYGYAEAPKAAVRDWTALIHDYLRARPNLARVFLLIDARHGLKPADAEVLETLDRSAVSYQAVLTKADKPSVPELGAVTDALARALAKHPAAHPHILVTSSREGTGMESLRRAIAALLPAGN